MHSTQPILMKKQPASDMLKEFLHGDSKYFKVIIQVGIIYCTMFYYHPPARAAA